MTLAEWLGETGRDILIASALVVITATLLLRLYRRLGRRSTATSAFVRSSRSADAPPPSANVQREHRLQPPADLNRWKIEMYDLARDLSAQLDSKMGALEQLILLADNRIARLEALLEKAEDAAAHAGESDPAGGL